MLVYHTATVPGRWEGRKNEARRVACKLQHHQAALVEDKVAGLSFEEDVTSFWYFSMLKLTCVMCLFLCVGTQLL